MDPNQLCNRLDGKRYEGSVPGGSCKYIKKDWFHGDLDCSKFVYIGYVCLVTCPDGSIHYRGECPTTTTTTTTTTINPAASYCEEQGYEYDAQRDVCINKDLDLECNAWDYYNKKCNLECRVAKDCEGKVHIMTVGYWECRDNTCFWLTAECVSDRDCIDKFRNCDMVCIDNRCIAKPTEHPPRTCPSGAVVNWLGYPDCKYEPCPECLENETKEYLCPDGTSVKWCYCEEGRWICTQSPERLCIGHGFCYDNNDCKENEICIDNECSQLRCRWWETASNHKCVPSLPIFAMGILVAFIFALFIYLEKGK